MYLRIIFILYFIFTFFTDAWAQPGIVNIRTYGGPQIESGNEILEAPDGGYYIIGTTASVDDATTNFYLIKVDTSLTFEWSKVYGGGNIDWGQSICSTIDGNYMLLGYSNSFGFDAYDVLLYKVSPSGEVLWSQNYGGNDWDFGYKIKPHPSGGYIILGETYSFGHGNNDTYLIKIDEAGVVEWEQSYGSEFEDVGIDIEIDSNGNIHCLQQSLLSEDGGYSQQILIINELGDLLDLDIRNDLNYNPKTIVLVGDDYYIGGSTTDEEEVIHNYGMRLTSQFGEEWSVFGAGESNDEIEDALFYNDKFYFAGFTENFGNGQKDVLAVRRVSDGAWNGGTTIGNILDDISHSIYMDSQENILIAGSSQGNLNNSSDVYLIRYSLEDFPQSVQNLTEDLLIYSDISLSISNELDQGFTLYPNPCKSEFNIETGKSNRIENLQIFESTGRIINPSSYIVNNTKVDVSQLKNGVYFVLYKQGDRNYSLPLVIRK